MRYLKQHYESIERMCEEINRGGEIEFCYQNKRYSITHVNDKICIIEFNNYKTEVQYDNCYDIINYMIKGKKLKDIFFEIEIVFSCFD